jgi:predicted HicB family RNase H-like nuclease
MTDQQTMENEQQAIQAATELFDRKPDWVTFYREIMGVDGIVRKLYPTADALANFEQTEEFTKIQQMLARLRSGTKADDKDSKEPTRVITVRLPKSLHDTLKAEAHNHHTSMNQLCIAKLLQMVDDELIPTEKTE